MTVVGKLGYKETKAGWIPADWTAPQMQEIGTVIRGASPRPQGDPRYYGGSVPRLMGADVTRDGKWVTPKIDFLTEAGAKLSRPCSKETLTITCSGNVGIPAFLAVDACIHDGFLALVDIDESKANKDFLYHVISSLKQRLDSSATHGGVFTNLTTTILKEFCIPFPPLSEQQKIAAILTTVDDKLDVIARQIATTQTLKQGLMQTLFRRGVGTQNAQGRWVPHTGLKNSELGEMPPPWSCDKLGTHVAKVGSGVTPKGGSTAYLASGIPLIRSQNVLVGRLSLDDVAFISDEQHAKMRGSALLPNDVLLNITGASIGRCAVLPPDFTAGNVNQHVCIIRLLPSLNPYYLCHYLNAEAGQRQIDKFQAGGNREGLNFQQIRSFDVPVPILSEQEKISSVLGGIDDKLAVLAIKAGRFQTLKRGLMQKLLTGEWRVKCDVLVAEIASTGASATNATASEKKMSSVLEEAL